MKKILLLSILFISVGTHASECVKIFDSSNSKPYFKVTNQKSLSSIKKTIKEYALEGKPIPRPQTNPLLFSSNYETFGTVKPTATREQLKNEVSMYSATLEFARENSGPIVRGILDQIPQWYIDATKKLGLYVNIDVRVHQYMKKMIPEIFEAHSAVPGWHADGELRQTYHSQPDLEQVPISFHVVGSISTKQNQVTNTQFLKSLSLEMHVPNVKNVNTSSYKTWDEVSRFVEKNIPTQEKNIEFIEDGRLVLFDARTLHRTSPVKSYGSRLFLRLSMWHKPNLEQGKISHQEQIYLIEKEEIKPRKNLRSINEEVKVLGELKKSQYEIEAIAEEANIFGATLSEAKQNGNKVYNDLINQIPKSFLKEAKEKGLKPIVDIMNFRLYTNYRPFFPDYSGKPKDVDSHIPSRKKQKELWMFVSSEKDGVSSTEFNNQFKSQPGQIIETYSNMPRKEIMATSRGWRVMLRLRLVPESQKTEMKKLDQQYLHPHSLHEGY